MRFIAATLLSFVALATSEDFACGPGKSSKRILIKKGDSFSFNTNPDGAATYQPKMKCSVVYRRAKTCKKMKFSCSSFDVDNKAAACNRGDRMQVGKQKFCKQTGPDVETNKILKIRFLSNKAKQASGAQCTIQCDDGSGSSPSPAPTPAPADCTCGLANRAQRIVGGVETEVNEYPWQAGLVNKNSGFIWCGGSLVNSRYVLTAAHCTKGKKPSSMQVLLGEHKKYDTTESDMLRLDVVRKYNHPGYNKVEWLDKDFSILRLAKDVDFAKYPKIRPVCLPTDTSRTYAGDTATVSGWGTTESGGSTSSYLQEVSVVVMTNEQCSNPPYGYDPEEITDSMMCAGVVGGGKDSCQGDSGGPLVLSDGDGVTAGQNYFQIGVVSWGYGCAEAEHPGVYARVTSEVAWIQEKMKGGKSCPAA